MKNIVCYEKNFLLREAVNHEKLHSVKIQEENEELLLFVDKYAEAVLINADDFKWEDIQNFIVQLKNYKDELVIIIGSSSLSEIKRDAFMLGVYNFLDFNNSEENLSLPSQILKTLYSPKTHKDCINELKELISQPSAPVIKEEQTVVEAPPTEVVKVVHQQSPKPKKLIHLDVKGSLVYTYAYANLLAHHLDAKLDWCNDLTKENYFQKKVKFLEDPDETNLILVAPTKHNHTFDDCYIIIDVLEHCIYNETHQTSKLPTSYRPQIIEVNSEFSNTNNTFSAEQINKIYLNHFDDLEYDLSCFGLTTNSPAKHKSLKELIWKK